MARDEAYREAEKIIEEARQSGATELYLQGMNLTELPETLWELNQLQLLDLSHNTLTILPDSIGQLSQFHIGHLSSFDRFVRYGV